MRRICMSALVLSALSGSAYADSIQNIFSPYAPSQLPSQPAYAGQQQATQSAPNQPMNAQPMNVPQRGLFSSAQGPAYTGTVPQSYAPPSYAPQSYAPPAQQGYAQPGQQPAAPAPAQTSYALPPPPPSNGGGFFAALFGHSWGQPASYQPAAPDYQAQPQQGFAPSGQGDMANYQIDPKYDRQTVDYRGDEPAGTIVIDTPNKFLYLVGDSGKALRYGIGVGRPGFTWAGVKTISAKKEWPDWRPPADMLQRRPDLPRYMPGGVDNPLGARAMYLGSTLYRIHGSNEPWTIGTNVSSGCIRMRNEDVEDLYGRVKVGTKVVVI
jgi:lipoprotein-anchoring transpeptidase ErfK/SrfK